MKPPSDGPPCTYIILTYLCIFSLDLEQLRVLEYDGAVGLLGVGGGGRAPEGLPVRLGQEVVSLEEGERHPVSFSRANISNYILGEWTEQKQEARSPVSDGIWNDPFPSVALDPDLFMVPQRFPDLYIFFSAHLS